MKTRQILNLIALLGTVIVNGLANALPFNGITTGEISDSFPVLFTPAGYVFSIWGVIYLLLFGFAVYQALPSQRDNPRLERIGYWFVLSSLFNAVWIFLWHYGYFLLTLLAMLGLLVSLIVIYQRLQIARKIRNQQLDSDFRVQAFDPEDGLGEVRCAAVRQIITIDRGHHDMV